MKEILKDIISKFKKFWNRRKKVIKTDYYHKDNILFFNKPEPEPLTAMPLEFRVSNIRGYDFEDIAVKTKKKQGVFIKKDFSFIIFIVHKI